jgi:hypothetical protein
MIISMTTHYSLITYAVPNLLSLRELLRCSLELGVANVDFDSPFTKKIATATVPLSWLRMKNISSFLGIGGGITNVPALCCLLGFPIHVAAATSHFILVIMALVGARILTVAV